MVKLIISFAIGFATTVGVFAQTPASTPPSQPRPSSTPAPQPPQTSPQLQRAIPIGGRTYSNFPLNPISESDRLSARVVRLQTIIAPLYRKPNLKETASLAPDASFIQRYASMLKLDGTGIVRLATDVGCVHSERVISAAEGCLKFSFPGAGNSFSFRTESYRLRHLADITYTNEKLRITGIFMHGIAVDIGDVPIEAASLSTEGVDFLTTFKPSTTSTDVAVIDLNLARGVRSGHFIYSKEIDPSVNRTYAIRAVAYRGKVVRSAGGVRYNELDYDKRRDVTVVFRVLEINNEGITLVWRKLSDTEPPRIKMPKADKEVDDDEAN